MLSSGRSIVSSGVSTRVSGTGSPSTVRARALPGTSTARAHSRSSASLLPKNGGGSTVLHSMVTAATKIFVPRSTVHVGGAAGSSVNGATTPSRSTHQGSPAASGFSGTGVSSTVSQSSPSRVASARSGAGLDWMSGAADAAGAVTTTPTTTASRTRARRHIGLLLFGRPHRAGTICTPVGAAYLQCGHGTCWVGRLFMPLAVHRQGRDRRMSGHVSSCRRSYRRLERPLHPVYPDQGSRHDQRQGHRSTACRTHMTSDTEHQGLSWQSFVGSSPDRKSTRLNSSHANISYAVFCL